MTRGRKSNSLLELNIDNDESSSNTKYPTTRHRNSSDVGINDE